MILTFVTNARGRVYLMERDPPPDLKPRTGRSVPALLKIATYWHQRPDIGTILPRWRGLEIGLGEPFCGACGWLVPVKPLDIATPEEGGVDFPVIWQRSSQWLDRAHIITRSTGQAGSGLDVPANLIQLCQLCHKQMPLFDAGDEDRAMKWLQSTPRCDSRWQVFTDTYPWGDGRQSMTRVFLMYQRLVDQFASEGVQLGTVAVWSMFNGVTDHEPEDEDDDEDDDEEFFITSASEAL